MRTNPQPALPAQLSKCLDVGGDWHIVFGQTTSHIQHVTYDDGSTLWLMNVGGLYLPIPEVLIAALNVPPPHHHCLRPPCHDQPPGR